MYIYMYNMHTEQVLSESVSEFVYLELWEDDLTKSLFAVLQYNDSLAAQTSHVCASSEGIKQRIYNCQGRLVWPCLGA